MKAAYWLKVALLVSSSIFAMNAIVDNVNVHLENQATRQVGESAIADFLKYLDPSVASMLKEGGAYPLLEMSPTTFDWLHKNLEILNDKDKLKKSLDDLYQQDFKTYYNLLLSAHKFGIQKVSAAGLEHTHEKLFEAINNPEKLAYFQGLFTLSKYPGVIGINLSFKGRPVVLITASEAGDAKMVQQLIKAGANLQIQEDEHGITPLMVAARENKKEIVKMLIDAKADLNKKSSRGLSALHEAAEGGFTDIADLLIKAGAQVDIINEHGFTPLMVAALWGDEKMVDLLIKAKADPNKKSSIGLSALHAAAANGFTNVADLLIKAGAPVDIIDEYGFTPLMSAARNGKEEMVDLLIKAKADPNKRVTEGFYVGKTALMLAQDGGYTKIVKLLQEGKR